MSQIELQAQRTVSVPEPVEHALRSIGRIRLMLVPAYNSIVAEVEKANAPFTEKAHPIRVEIAQNAKGMKGLTREDAAKLSELYWANVDARAKLSPILKEAAAATKDLRKRGRTLKGTIDGEYQAFDAILPSVLAMLG